MTVLYVTRRNLRDCTANREVLWDLMDRGAGPLALPCRFMCLIVSRVLCVPRSNETIYSQRVQLESIASPEEDRFV